MLRNIFQGDHLWKNGDTSISLIIRELLSNSFDLNLEFLGFDYNTIWMASDSCSRSAVLGYVCDERTSTRYKFTSHVCDELNQVKGVKFFNEDTIRKGLPRLQEIKRTLKDSWIAIVIISKSFCTKDCLDELLIILEQKKEKGDAFMVLPVFYLVNPDDVGTQVGSFAKVFVYLTRRYGAVKAEEWRNALAKLVQCTGYVVLPNESEVHYVSLVIGAVTEHVEWLYAKGIIPATLSEKSLGVETPVESSTKLRESLSSTVGGVELSTEEEKAEPGKNFNAALAPSRSVSKELCREETVESVELKGNRNEGECSEKLVSGHLTNYRSDDSRFKSSIRISSPKHKHSNESILQALLKLKAFLSQCLELDSCNLGDLRESFQILEGLTEVDGINIVEKTRLSILEKELASVIAQIHSIGEGMKEVDLAIQKYDQELYKFWELLEEKERVEKGLGELDSYRERLRAELTAIERRYEREEERRCYLINTIKSREVELQHLNDANLGEQKFQVEELEQDACERLEGIRELFDGLITKFSTKDKSRNLSLGKDRLQNSHS